MSRSRYRPPVSHSWFRRRIRSMRNAVRERFMATYDRRVGEMHGLERWERDRDPTMRVGYTERERRYLRVMRVEYDHALHHMKTENWLKRQLALYSSPVTGIQAMCRCGRVLKASR